MIKVTAFEAKTRFGKLLERVARGEEIVITRHEKAIARIAPEGQTRNEDVRKAVAGLRALQAGIKKRIRGQKPLTYADIKSAICGLEVI